MFDGLAILLQKLTFGSVQIPRRIASMGNATNTIASNGSEAPSSTDGSGGERCFTKTFDANKAKQEANNMAFAVGSEMQVSLTKSWAALPDDAETVGRKIFYRIFSEIDSLAEAYNLQNCPPLDLSTHPSFTTHGKLIGRFLGTLVEDITNGHEFVSGVRDLGCRHAQLNILDAPLFQPDYCDVAFAAAVEEIYALFYNVAKNNETRHKWKCAWHSLLTYVTAEMKNAYYKQKFEAMETCDEESRPVGILAIFHKKPSLSDGRGSTCDSQYSDRY